MKTTRGFTLIEVVVAVGMTAFIGTGIAVAFNTTIAAKEVVETEGERYRMVQAAMGRMAREIGAAYVSDRYDPRRFRDQFDRPTNFVGTRDKLMFSSLAHQRLYADAKESDQMVVEYSVKSATGTKGGKSRYDLIRREKLIFEENMERGGSEDVLFEDLKKVEFEFWNSERKQWDNEWDTRRTERKSILPTRVRITLHATDEGGKDVKYTTQTRVVLNTEFPRYQ